jgi:hypothetical protein
MVEFLALRARARDKRDRLIAQARKEYEATLVRIAAIEQDLLGGESSRHKKVSACIESVMPLDRPFTTVDILTSLEALDSGLQREPAVEYQQPEQHTWEPEQRWHRYRVHMVPSIGLLGISN